RERVQGQGRREGRVDGRVQPEPRREVRGKRLVRARPPQAPPAALPRPPVQDRGVKSTITQPPQQLPPLDLQLPLLRDQEGANANGQACHRPWAPAPRGGASPPSNMG